MKKFISVFLSVYIITLIFSPCQDKEITSVSGMHEMINLGQTGNHDDHHDCCSPLCTCSCCSLPFETAKTFIVTQDFTQSTTLIFFIDPKIESHYLFTIWEPPKA
jgi:hypothetical protein